MKPALIELITTIATQPNTGAAGTALTGDSLVVRNGDGVHMVSAWGSRQVAGFSQFNWPSAHDTTRGYRAGVAAAKGQLTIPLGAKLPMIGQELISSTISGSNTSGDIESDAYLIAYEKFPGLNGRFMGPDEVLRRAKLFTTVESSISSVSTGQYVSELINADSDLLRQGDYAVLGMSSRTAVNSMFVYGPDFGNVRVGVPGNLRPEITQQWFLALSRATGYHAVPVFNSGNKNNITVGFQDDENAATTLVTVHLAYLG